MKIPWILALAFLPIIAAAEIQVVSATYGRNCGATPDNAKAVIAHACNGKQTCEYSVDLQVLPDPVPGCSKAFVTEWVCAAGAAHRKFELAAAGQGSVLKLSCQALGRGGSLNELAKAAADARAAAQAKIDADARAAAEAKAATEAAAKAQVDEAAHDASDADGAAKAKRPMGLLLRIDSITPKSPRQSGPFDVAYTFTNATQSAEKGVLTGTLLNHPLRTPQGNLQQSLDLPPGGQQQGHFMLAATSFSGKGSVILRYLGQIDCVDLSGPDRFARRSCQAGSSAEDSRDITVELDTGTLADEDHDQIYDLIEDALLERYRPYIYYTADDDYRPTDVEKFVQGSELNDPGVHVVLMTHDELTTHPYQILNIPEKRALGCAGPPGWLPCDDNGSGACRAFPTFEQAKSRCASDLTIAPLQTLYRLDPNDTSRSGADWFTVETRKNVGLYGHVAPVYLQSESATCKQRWNEIDNKPGPGRHLYYKVEYWQFFGFNDSGSWGVGKHEGDWISLQVLLLPPAGLPVNPDGHVDFSGFRVISVMMYAHAMEWRFDLASADDGDPIPVEDGLLEWQGPNKNKNEILIASTISDDQCNGHVMDGQNRRLRAFRDPQTQEPTHFVAYAERGSHELWPTPDGKWVGAASHDGAGPHHFLTATPPNLGEVEYPRAGFAPGLLVLRFNGKWGTDVSSQGDPAQGPPLHDQWTYPPCDPASLYPQCTVGPKVMQVHHGY